MNNLEFYARYAIAWDQIEIYAAYPIKDSARKVANPLTFSEKQSGETVDPIIRVSREDAQTLMDSLWDAGIRPKSGIGSAGQLEAIKYHLEDMRKLVFINDRSSSKHT